MSTAYHVRYETKGEEAVKVAWDLYEAIGWFVAIVAAGENEHVELVFSA